MVMTHSQRKSSIKLKDFEHLRDVILNNFPDLEGKVFHQSIVTFGDITYLISLCGFRSPTPISANISTYDPLVNYMIDNKHLYDWWKL